MSEFWNVFSGVLLSKEAGELAGGIVAFSGGVAILWTFGFLFFAVLNKISKTIEDL